MIVRNLEFNKLNQKEKSIVRKHYKECLNDCKLNCSKCDCSKSINVFWEIHREEDTDNGTYTGWIE